MKVINTSWKMAWPSVTSGLELEYRTKHFLPGAHAFFEFKPFTPLLVFLPNVSYFLNGHHQQPGIVNYLNSSKRLQIVLLVSAVSAPDVLRSNTNNGVKQRERELGSMSPAFLCVYLSALCSNVVNNHNSGSNAYAVVGVSPKVSN